MRAAKGSETHLRWIVRIRVCVIDRSAGPSQNQKRLEVCLEEHVDVDPLANVSAVANVTSSRIEHIGRLTDSALNREPRIEVRHVVDTRKCGGDSLLEFVRTIVTVLVEVLRQVWTFLVTGSQTSE